MWSFTTMICVVRFSWLRRSESFLSRASSSGMLFSLPPFPSCVLIACLSFCSLLLFLNSNPFSPTCRRYKPVSTFSHRWSFYLSLKQCFQLVMSWSGLVALRCCGCWGAQFSSGFASISCHQSWSWATLVCHDPLVNCGYQPDTCFSSKWI